ncbi:cation:proton antiporter [Mangrovicoccus algicola]|uniref:Cation:proton antiporter n=1 Tax=Mangrovicoccus algicola TaxID=2771008 RepID=A0A8J6YXF7_9RHOB|nr:cation:proton antiporter [Mangrovicoccus algicola]MBE3639472.1 cation:proton antiporter [Mangrovicoccus algicola]
MTATLIIAIVTIAWCLLSRRLSQTVVTAPMVFILLGYALAEGGGRDAEVIHVLHAVAELALVVLLFLDAAQTDLRKLRSHRQWPVRMLLVGLPLAVALGTGMVALLAPNWPLATAALAAAILAPTDAALGQAVISNPQVPARQRQALTVESGLNDGLALPLVLMLASLAAGTGSGEGGYWLRFAAAQVILGPAAGIAVGWAGARLMNLAVARGTSSEAFEGIATLALAGAAYVLADLLGGNGFIAAFAGGLAFGHVVTRRSGFVYHFAEGDGQILAWSAFLLIGLGLMPDAVRALDGRMLAIILLSLFVIRPAAIWLSLAGTDADGPTRLFFGWFGPRGLATALFALLVVPDIDPVEAEPILHLAVNAVWISAMLHGITAAPLSRRFARRQA